MSHTAKINTKFKDANMNSFKRAFHNLGWTLKQNTSRRTYPYDEQRDTVYPMVMVNPMKEGYDIGVSVDQKTHEIELSYDTYGGSIERSLGKDLLKLKSEYNCCVIEDVMAFQGYVTTRQTQSNGTIMVHSVG